MRQLERTIGRLARKTALRIAENQATAASVKGADLADLLGPADRAPGFDVLVMAAAVADFRPRSVADGKLQRADGLTLELVPTPDILAGVAATARVQAERPGAGPRPVLVGFAAETGSLERAPEKLRRKGVDLLVGNDVSEAGSGFGTDTNRVSILRADGAREPILRAGEWAFEA